MIAFITQRESVDSHGTKIDILESDYVSYFEKFNIQLYPVSNFSELVVSSSILDRIELIILTGGGDIDEVLNSDGEDVFLQKNRDQIEKKLLDLSIRKSLPVLGICRGFQFMNKYLGGQISRLNYEYDRPIGKSHPIQLFDSEILVNNYHRDGIKLDQLASNLEMIGVDIDNKHVEAFFSKSLKWLGLQWHPERNLENMKSREATDKMISRFITKRAIK